MFDVILNSGYSGVLKGGSWELEKIEWNMKEKERNIKPLSPMKWL